MEDKNTIAFKESNGQQPDRWSSFYDFIPDMMIGMNNSFFSFKDGELYEHDTGPINTFYGVRSASTIAVVFNELPSKDKVFYAVSLEGTNPWDIDVESNLTASDVTASEFAQRESRFFAYLRRNTSSDLKSFASVGIGNLVSSVGTTLTFSQVNERLSVGDQLYQNQSGTLTDIGTVTAVTTSTVIVNALVNTPIDGSFCYGAKNARMEGSPMRGYYLLAELTLDAETEVELFAVNATIAESHV